MRRFYQSLIPSIVRLNAHKTISPAAKMGSSSSKSFTLKPTPATSPKEPKTPAQLPETTKMASSSDEEYVEAIVCHESDLKENDMKAFALGDAYTKVLVVRQNGTLTAVGSRCTHSGAPLEKGALGDGRVRCPWHGACFNIKSGDIEDYPGLDSLPCYQLTVQDNGDVKVRAKKSELSSNRRVDVGARRCHKDGSVFLVVGGGPAAASCVETLRKNNCRGRIVMIAKEDALPYDRVKISKALNSEVEKLQLRPQEFYNKNDIEVLKGVEATSVNTHAKSVTLSNGQCIEYSELFIATGSTPRLLSIPGHDLQNVFTLRTVMDGAAIHAVLGPDSDKNVVILGSSFIGMEAAAYCVGNAKTVTVIGRDQAPFSAAFGFAVGSAIKKFFEEKGVIMKMGHNIKKCIGDYGKLTAVELEDGTVLLADILLMGVGSTFNTGFLKDSGITLDRTGSVPVNDTLETNVKCVYAGGDIAYAPVYSHGGKPAAIGHFGLAHYHGRIAALNMLGKRTLLKTVPFFWTVLFGKSIRYCGHGKFHDLRIEGDVDALQFVVYYFDEWGHVIAMASCQRDPIVSQFAELLAMGKSLHSNDLQKDPFAWTNTYLNC